MHIPDGYLSPATCVVFYAGMVPAWYAASRKVERELGTREIPLLALGAAFTFVIMMFNIPVPGGSSGHMVGAAAVSVLLGPWAGVIALSLALTLQAFLFADGGVTALGANCFNMALVMSFTGYFAYRVVSAGGAGPVRTFIAAAAAGYVSVNAAALAVALEIGIQPLIATGPEGLPLYAPYGLDVAVPAMMSTHLLVFGPVEAVGTGAVVSYVLRTSGRAAPGGAVGAAKGRGGGLKPLWIALAALVVLTPLGLIATGSPWGEWSVSEVGEMVGFVPEGMERLSDTWRGVMPDYELPGAESAATRSLVYVIAALIGAAASAASVYLLSHRRR